MQLCYVGLYELSDCYDGLYELSDCYDGLCYIDYDVKDIDISSSLTCMTIVITPYVYNKYLDFY